MSLRLARRRHAPRQQLRARRRADHRHAQPRQRSPDDRSARRRQGAGPYLRRGDGAHRRRRVQRTTRSGTNSFHGSGFYQTRPIWGQTNNYFSQIASDVAAAKRRLGHRGESWAKPNSPYYLGGGGFGGPISQGPDVLLVLRPRVYTTRRRATRSDVDADRRRTGRRFLGRRQLQRPAGHDLRPADASAVPRQRHSGEPDQPGRGGDAASTCRCPTRNVDNGAANYNRTSLIKTSYTEELTGKVEHKFTDKVSLTGFYLYNQIQRALRRTTSGRRIRRSRTASPIRSTTSWCGVRRSWRVNNTWVVNDSSVMALRFGMSRFPDNNTLSLPFDPVDSGVLVDVQQPDRGAEVPGRPAARLRRERGSDAGRDQSHPD